MDDSEFLLYCDTHAESPRCGFVPEQIARLQRLAGHPGLAVVWERVPNQVVNCDRYDIRELVRQARARLEKLPSGVLTV